MRLPRLQISARGDPHAHMIEPCLCLDKRLPRIGVVAVQHEDELPFVIGQQLARATRVRFFQSVGEAEDTLVPGDAGVEIGDGEGDVMQGGMGWTWHGILHVVRARYGRFFLPLTVVDRSPPSSGTPGLRLRPAPRGSHFARKSATAAGIWLPNLPDPIGNSGSLAMWWAVRPWIIPMSRSRACATGTSSTTSLDATASSSI